MFLVSKNLDPKATIFYIIWTQIQRNSKGLAWTKIILMKKPSWTHITPLKHTFMTPPLTRRHTNFQNISPPRWNKDYNEATSKLVNYNLPNDLAQCQHCFFVTLLQWAWEWLMPSIVSKHHCHDMRDHL